MLKPRDNSDELLAHPTDLLPNILEVRSVLQSVLQILHPHTEIFDMFMHASDLVAELSAQLCATLLRDGVAAPGLLLLVLVLLLLGLLLLPVLLLVLLVAAGALAVP